MLLNLADDPVTLALLGMMFMLVVLPGVLLIARRFTRPPFGISSFRWLYLAWASLLAAALVWTFSRVPADSVEDAGTGNFVRLGFLALGGLVVLAVAASYRFALFSELATGALAIFFLFSLWGLASSAWSVSPAGTLYKSVEYCAMLWVIALAASLINLTIRNPRDRTFALKELFDFSWFLLFMLIASVYAGLLLWPEYAIMRNYRDEMGVLGFSLQGVMPGISANGVGQLGAVMGIVALARILLKPESRKLYMPVLAISVLTMVLTQSRSPILAFSVAVIVVLAFNRRFGLMLISGVLMGMALLTQYSDLMFEFMRRGQNDQNFTSLTGRSTYWQVSLDAVSEKLVGGYGAYSGGRYILETALGDDNVSTVHSLWIETLLDTGVVGIILLTGALGATWFWLFRLRAAAMADRITRLLWFECLGVLTVLCVRSVFSVSTVVWSWYVIFFGLILVFIAVLRRQVVQTSSAGAPVAQPLPAAGWRRPGL